MKKHILCRNLSKFSFHLNFWISPVTAKNLSKHDADIKRVSFVKSSKFNDFVFTIFFIIGLGLNGTL